MIVWDTETTGLPKPLVAPLEEQPKIIEFAGIRLDPKTLKETARLEFMCNPGEKLEAIITKITGITDADLADKKPFGFFYQPLVEFFWGEREMAAHNIAFDRSLLFFDLMRMDKHYAFPWPLKHLCTVEASYSIKNRRLKLSELHELAMGKPHKDAHRAMADVEALADCCRWLRKKGMF
jgi:DNA polymerase III epsilon subunit-like protein